MEESVYQNWVKLKNKMESLGENHTNSEFYRRACKCVETREDPQVPGYDEYYQHYLKFFEIV